MKYEECCRYALTLLDQSAVNLVEGLLESTDMFVRRDARVRLERMPGSEARIALEQDGTAVASFCDRVIAECKRVGIAAEMRKGSLYLAGSPMNIDSVFTRRHQPEAIPGLLQMISDMKAGRDPRARHDYYMRFNGQRS